MVLATIGERRVRHDRSGDRGANVGKPERLVSVAWGGALAAYGLRRRDRRGLALALLGAELIRRGATGRCVVYRALGVSTAKDIGRIPPREPGEVVSDAATVDARRAIKIERSIRIWRPRAELFAILRDFEHLAGIIPDLKSVVGLGEGRSHWVAKVPRDRQVEWNAEVINEIPDELIAWKTVGKPDVSHAGSVHFKDVLNGRGTEMRIVLDYEPPGGRLGAAFAPLARHFGQAADSKIRRNLRRFKLTMETEPIAGS
jgi:uncharacterized membrane protein